MRNRAHQKITGSKKERKIFSCNQKVLLSGVHAPQLHYNIAKSKASNWGGPDHSLLDTTLFIWTEMERLLFQCRSNRHRPLFAHLHTLAYTFAQAITCSPLQLQPSSQPYAPCHNKIPSFWLFNFINLRHPYVFCHLSKPRITVSLTTNESVFKYLKRGRIHCEISFLLRFFI